MGNRKGAKRPNPYVFHLPPRQCAFDDCTNMFVPMNSNQRYCTESHYRKCPICKKLFAVKDLVTPSETCSRACGHKLAGQRRSYGDDWKQKVIATNMAHRGTAYPMQSEACKLKSQQTSFKNWGVSHPMKCAAVKQKVAQAAIENWRSREGGWNCISLPNRRFAYHFKLAGIPFEYEFALGGFRYDIHVCNTNVLIEINPTATHNIKQHPWNDPPDATYHQRKSKCAYDNGYVCIHIFDWTDVVDIVLGLEYSSYFSISEHTPQCHWYNSDTHDHICESSIDNDSLLSSGYLPVYDDGYKINFIYKEDVKYG